MKLALIAILILPTFCFGQQPKFTDLFYRGGSIPQIIVFSDSSKRIEIIGDTMDNIRYLVTQVLELTKKLNAAKVILDCVTVYGFVYNKNRIRFNNAVNEWLNINHDKRKVDKMQKLDILTRDLKGNPTGWIKQ